MCQENSGFSVTPCIPLCVCTANGGTQCQDNEFKCPNPEIGCINKDWVCDGDDDCKDNSDEVGCGE